MFRSPVKNLCFIGLRKLECQHLETVGGFFLQLMFEALAQAGIHFVRKPDAPHAETRPGNYHLDAAYNGYLQVKLAY